MHGLTRERYPHPAAKWTLQKMELHVLMLGRAHMSAACVLPLMRMLWGVQVSSSNATFNIKYGTGTVSGQVARDVVVLADPPITVPDQALGMATSISSEFATASCDGIFVCPPPPTSPANDIRQFMLDIADG